jgi:arylsulfatase
MGQELEKVMKSFVQYPPRKLQSEGYTGPITISGYEQFENVKKQLKEYNIDINLGQ